MRYLRAKASSKPAKWVGKADQDYDKAYEEFHSQM